MEKNMIIMTHKMITIHLDDKKLFFFLGWGRGSLFALQGEREREGGEGGEGIELL